MAAVCEGPLIQYAYDLNAPTYQWDQFTRNYATDIPDPLAINAGGDATVDLSLWAEYTEDEPVEGDILPRRIYPSSAATRRILRLR